MENVESKMKKTSGWFRRYEGRYGVITFKTDDGITHAVTYSEPLMAC